MWQTHNAETRHLSVSGAKKDTDDSVKCEAWDVKIDKDKNLADLYRAKEESKTFYNIPASKYLNVG